jgi:hypothetical protein
MRPRRADMQIESYRGTVETLELVRERDGELRYEADDVPAPPAVAGLVLFLDLEGAVCGQTPAAAIPPDVDAVLAGTRVFVRSGPQGFREARTITAHMP